MKLFKDRPTRGARDIVIAGALSLSFSLGGCADDSTTPIDEADSGPDCDDFGGCYDEGYVDEGYLDEGYLDEGYVDEGYLDEGWQEYSESFDEGWPEEGYYTGPDPTITDPTITDSSDSWTTLTTDTMWTTGSSGDTESTLGSTGSSGSTGTGSSGSTGDTTGTSGESSSGTDTDTDTDTGGVEVMFPPLGVFGDDVIEPDLVGTWSLQWTPDASTWDSVLTIDDSGNFIWRETSADCSTDTLATGALWVEPGQIVMHVETWERQLPWDTLAFTGQEFPPPFRLRMSYALLGPNLGLAATERVVEAAPYTGRAYLQTLSDGKFIAGEWVGETELLAAFDGESEPKVIVRDRWIALLDPEPADVPESTGIVVHDSIYWGLDPPIAAPEVFEFGNWTCLEGCPQPAGATLIDGGNLYAYGPYAGFQRMMVFMSGRSFKRDVDTDCP